MQTRNAAVISLGLFALLAWIPTAATAAGANSPATAFAAKAISCACYQGTELRVDKKLTLADEACACDFADRIRRDLASVVSAMPAVTLGDKRDIALKIEDEFLPLSPQYERLFRYDPVRYRWFLENVRCTCEGCKATVYFSNCQLSCAPAIVYKRRARIFLALNFTTDQLIDFYLAEHNASHAHREQVTREHLLPRRQKKRGWMVPAVLILGAILGLGLLLRRMVRKSTERADAESIAEDKSEHGGGLSAAERARILDELDDLDD